jgi:hypothetical protein
LESTSRTSPESSRKKGGLKSLATSYVGNPATPSLASGVTIVEPADGDGANAASVNNPGPFQQIADLVSLLALGPLPGQTVASGSPIPSFAPPVLIDIDSGHKQAVSYQLLWSYALASGTNKRHIRAFMRGDGVLTLTMNANVTNNGVGSGWWIPDDPAFASTALWIGGDMGAQSTNDAGGMTMAVVANPTTKAYSGSNQSWSETIAGGYAGNGWGSSATVGTSSQSNSGSNYTFGNGVNGLSFAIGGNPAAWGSWQFNKALTCIDATDVSQFPIASFKKCQIAGNLICSAANIPSGGFGVVPPTITHSGSWGAVTGASLDGNSSESCGLIEITFTTTASSPGSVVLATITNPSGLNPEAITITAANQAAALIMGPHSQVWYSGAGGGVWQLELYWFDTSGVGSTTAIFAYEVMY